MATDDTANPAESHIQCLCHKSRRLLLSQQFLGFASFRLTSTDYPLSSGSPRKIRVLCLYYCVTNLLTENNEYVLSRTVPVWRNSGEALLGPSRTGRGGVGLVRMR